MMFNQRKKMSPSPHAVSGVLVFSQRGSFKERKQKEILSGLFALAGIALIAASLVATQANAQSAQEKADQLQQEIKLAEEAKDAEKKCGTKIETEIDWKAFEKGKWREKRYSLYSYCANAVEALESLCIGKRSKKYIKANVKKVRCTLAKEGKRGMKKKGKVLLFSMDPAASNNAQWARGAALDTL